MTERKKGGRMVGREEIVGRVMKGRKSKRRGRWKGDTENERREEQKTREGERREDGERDKE